MKRLALLFIGIMLFPLFSHAGGIVTNTNQSAAWVRMFARDASTGIDAVYFNPAGLAKLKGDGLFISLNEQIITQNRYISSNYAALNTSDFEGSVFAPIFPGIYAAYKTGKFTVSFGANVIGGGGSAVFENSLPLFEMGVSDLKAGLTARGLPTTAYSMKANLDGSSVFWGYQLGLTYAINDMISVYVGARYVSAKNTYQGSLTDVMINTAHPVYNPTLGMISAPDFFANLSADAAAAATKLGEITAGGGGDYTPEFLHSIGQMSDVEYATLAAGYTSLGLDPTVNTISEGIAPFTASAGESYVRSVLLADQEDVDIEQTGSGFAPIIGVNLSLLEEKLNIGMKYEFRTKIELENNTEKDFIVGYNPATSSTVGMFPDGEKVNSDMPAQFTLGADYKITDKFSVAVGGHYYFDKQADYGKKINGVYVDNDQVINKGLWEAAIGFEYKITEKFLLSLGYLHTQIGVKEVYQSNLSYTNSSNSIGFGGAYKVTPNLDLNIGVGYTTYESFDKNYEHNFAGTGVMVPVTETYDKDNLFIALGLDFKLFGK
jgi:long-subunit fatty acid transport protein